MAASKKNISGGIVIMNKNRFTILPTLDYELFGDGSGDVLKDVVDPTWKMLKICDKFDCRITLFVDILEFVRIRGAQQDGQLNHLSYNVWDVVTEQLIAAHSKGHDIQMHVHPQWLAAEFGNGKWKLDPRASRLPELVAKIGLNETENLLKQLKAELEAIIRPFKPDYSVIAFRAGGFSIQPERAILSMLKNLGIKIDSSTYFGGFHRSNGLYYDFRCLPENLPFWKIDETIFPSTAPNPASLIELPVLSFNAAKIFKYNSRRIYSKMVHHINNNKQHDSHSRIERSKSGNSILWDFCLQSTPLMLFWLWKAMQKFNRHRSSAIPLIMMGHPKDFKLSYPFSLFLILARNVRNIDFATFSQWYDLSKDI